MIHIIGGGLIGLASAFELAQRGHDVRVHERGEAARSASWAGAGMLAPFTEGVRDDEFGRMCARSLELYPRFAGAVQSKGGVDPKLQLDGIVTVAFDDEAFRELTRRAGELRAFGVACRMLDRSETLKREPALSGNVRGALLLQAEGTVDNRRLGRGLVAACRASGVEIVEHCGQLAVVCDERRVLGIRTELGFTPAAYVVNAAGAWSSRVDGIPPQALPDVFPVKGQMLALAIPEGFVRHTVWLPGAYVVPREHGRILIGATEEHAGYDERVTAQGVNRLLSALLDSMPALGDFSITEMWAGLRPGTPDSLPRIGRTALEGLYNASGHYRNGILLAPVTATMVADAIEQTEAFAGS